MTNTIAGAAMRSMVVTLSLCGCLAAAAARAQTATQPGLRSVYLETADKSRVSLAVDKRLAARIEKSGALRVVRSKGAADAVLRVAAVVWPEGTYVANPRSGAVGVAAYRGYASADLVSSTGEPLWSYLATPKPLRLTGVTGDLGDQLFAGLQAALAKGMALSAVTSTTRTQPGQTLRVAGATFPAPLYRRWFESYAEQANRAPIRYEAAGSVAGTAMLQAGKIDIAASDIPEHAGETAFEQGLLRLPTVVGGVVPIVNLPGAGRDLRFTAELLADIYSGKVHRWNDPTIRRWNKEARLPDAEIQVVHRSDGSGTSFVWTSFLATASDAWKGKAGAIADWPVGVGELGNEGVAAEVQTTPNAIGYVELTYAVQHRLPYASVRNPAGQFIRADLDSLEAAAQSAVAAGDKTDGSLLNEPGIGTYPIATFTYFLVPQPLHDDREATAVADLLRWVLVEGQRQCASLGYAPLPREVAARELALLKGLK
jgi:phosphate ABC transporter phosphate-binding protein